jgi:hypothetical protein
MERHVDDNADSGRTIEIDRLRGDAFEEIAAEPIATDWRHLDVLRQRLRKSRDWGERNPSDNGKQRCRVSRCMKVPVWNLHSLLYFNVL